MSKNLYLTGASTQNGSLFAVSGHEAGCFERCQKRLTSIWYIFLSYSLEKSENIMEKDLSIPKEQRSPKIEPFLKEMLAVIINLRNSELINKVNYSINLYSLIYPWLVETANEEKQMFSNFGFNGDEVKYKLNEILQDNKHLRERCVNEFVSAMCDQKYFRL